MQKFKTRNFLTAILALLCAVTVALGITFALPNNEKMMDVDAATTINVDVRFDAAKYWSSLNSNPNRNSVAYSAMSNTKYNCITSFTATGGVGTGSVSTVIDPSISDYQPINVIAVPLILSVEVPAHTVYKISYSIRGELPDNTSLSVISDDWKPYSGNIDDIIINGYCYQTDDPSNVSGFGVQRRVPTTYNNYSMLLYNACDTVAVMELYTIHIETLHLGSDGYHNAGNNTISFSIGCSATLETVLGAPTALGGNNIDFDGTIKSFNIDYNTVVNGFGTGKIFNFVYNSFATDVYGSNMITCSDAGYHLNIAAEAFDFDGKTISASSYDLNDIKSGNFKATEAGTYKIKFNLTSAAIAAGITWSDGSTSEKTLTFTINRESVTIPTVLNATQTYKGGEYEFSVSNYDSAKMSVNTSGLTSSVAGTTVTWDSANEKFKATDAAVYTVKFKLASPNYMWSDNTSTDQSKTITISKKELTINTSNSTTSASNPTFDFGTAGNMTVNAVASGISNPDFELNMYYIKDGDTANPLTTGVDATTNTLDVSQISSSGSYTLCVELTGATSNKNYSIANGKYEYAFTIGSGSIDFSVINWQYREGTGNASDLFVGGVQEVLRYKLDSGSAVKYYILADIAAGGYLSIDANYNSNGYTNGFMTTNASGATVQYADGVGKYKTRIALKTDADHKFKSGGSNNGSFGGDDLSGWYEIEWEISKGKIDQDYLDNLNKNLQYKVAGGSWQTYDPDNPPEYGNGAVEIRLNPAKYPDGVSGANITINNKNTNIGTYTAQVTLTTDTTNYEPVGTQTFQWRIAAQAIEVDWTSGFWTDVNGDNVLDDYGAPYQIKELNISDDLKQYVEYHYYLANSDLTMGAFVGVGDVGLEALKGAPHNASSNTPVDVYVKAVIKSGVTQYELKDPSGNDCATLFKLGDTKTLAKVSQTETEMEYGGDKLTGGIVSIIGEDTNAELSGNFIAGIYIYDAAGNNLGLLKDYDGTTAAVGVYTIKIVLTEAGEDTYTLTPGTTMKFTVKPKSIALPTLNEIVFNNTFIDVRDYMGGSWAEYKEIIKVGGTYDGVKNVGNYSLTLTITDGNYCWDYGTDATPSKAGVRNSLADSGVSWSGDETIAECGWAITPYVLKPGGWNLKGKDGAVYNIPAELTDGLDVGINYLYHTDKTGNALGEGDSLKAGSTYFVKAQLLGADSGNFIFEDSNAATSDFATYKIPQSGAAAFMNTVKDFMTGTWLGLPVWSWFLIGLALLILLIIIIVVAAKRRKSKEEREAKKAAKEEEKARREEERRLQQERLEEERRLQREKLEAEREIAKAKQEAELEKIRAQAQLSGAAGIASVATAVPQAVQQQQPVQQAQQPMQPSAPLQQMPYLNQPSGDMAAVLAKIEAELAQIRAEQNVSRGFNSPTQSYGPQPMGDINAVMLAKMEAEFAKMQARQEASQEVSAAKMELEFFKLHGFPMNYANLYGYNQFAQQAGKQIADMPNRPGNYSADEVGAIMAAMMRNMGVTNAELNMPQKPAELPQVTEESKNSSSASYPPDAVITTTTTVDTTKKGGDSQTVRSEQLNDGRLFDIDGFYDSFESK